nr:hypothetical protein [Vibrio neptunius]
MDDKIFSLYAKGMTTREIVATFKETAFFKVVVIICLFIKQLLFQDLGGLHQLVHSS